MNSFYVQGDYDTLKSMDNLCVIVISMYSKKVKSDILSNGCDRSDSECHIVGDMK